MPQTYLADFHGQAIEIIDHQSQPWIRGSQIATPLGYAQTSRITELYKRHADEFMPDMTAVIKVQTAGGPQTVRIFSPRGAWLLAMFANTPKAKAFRQWVLDVLEQRQTQPGELSALREAVLRQRPDLAKVRRYSLLGLNNNEIARLLGRGEKYVRLRRQELRRCGLLDTQAPRLEGGAQ